jgi:hypothetical protein
MFNARCSKQHGLAVVPGRRFPPWAAPCERTPQPDFEVPDEVGVSQRPAGALSRTQRLDRRGVPGLVIGLDQAGECLHPIEDGADDSQAIVLTPQMRPDTGPWPVHGLRDETRARTGLRLT